MSRPASDPVALQQLAWEHGRRGDLPAAIAALREAIAILTAEDGPESLDAANLSTELAALLERTNRYAEAAEAASRAIGTLTEIAELGELAAILVRAHAIHSMALRAMGRFGEARHHIGGACGGLLDQLDEPVDLFRVRIDGVLEL